MIIHLVRHGEHDEVGKVLSGRSEIALNTVGQNQAFSLAEFFAGGKVCSIHSSPRLRTRQTALPLSEQTGCEVHVSAALDEIDFGRFAGQAFAALGADPDWQFWNAARGVARCPGGETMREAVDRATSYIRATRPADAPAVLVTHCDIIRGIVADQLGLGLDAMFRFDCDPGSITSLDVSSGHTRLIALNVPGQR